MPPAPARARGPWRRHDSYGLPFRAGGWLRLGRDPLTGAGLALATTDARRAVLRGAVPLGPPPRAWVWTLRVAAGQVDRWCGDLRPVRVRLVHPRIVDACDVVNFVLRTSAVGAGLVLPRQRRAVIVQSASPAVARAAARTFGVRFLHNR